MAKDSFGKGVELEKRLSKDNYMRSAVCECYASFKNIINFLVLGEREKVYVNGFWNIHYKKRLAWFYIFWHYYLMVLLMQGY